MAIRKGVQNLYFSGNVNFGKDENDFLPDEGSSDGEGDLVARK